MSLNNSIEYALSQVKENAHQVAILEKLRQEAIPLQERGLIDSENKQEITPQLLLAVRFNQRIGSILPDEVKVEQLRWWKEPGAPEDWQRAMTGLSELDRKRILSVLGRVYHSERSFRSLSTNLKYCYGCLYTVPNPDYEKELQERRSVGFLRELGLEGILELRRSGYTTGICLYTYFTRLP